MREDVSWLAGRAPCWFAESAVLRSVMYSCPSVAVGSQFLALSSSFHPPERTQSEPGERNREAHREQQPAWSGRVARLVPAVLAQASYGSDPSHRQKHESRHFQPELVQNPPEGLSRRPDSRQQRPAGPAALQHLGDRTENLLDFSRRLAVDHWSVTIG